MTDRSIEASRTVHIMTPFEALEEAFSAAVFLDVPNKPGAVIKALPKHIRAKLEELKPEHTEVRKDCLYLGPSVR